MSRANNLSLVLGDRNNWGDQSLQENGITLDELLSGDHQVIDKLYSDYFPVVRQLVLNNSGKHEDAEDLFQEALLVIFRKGKYDGLRITCSLSTYLYSVARNLWLQRLRLKRTHDKYELSAGEPLMDTSDNDYLEEARRSLYAEHFNKLSPDCQKVIRMSFEQKTLEEIAAEMGYKGGNYAKTKKFNCKEILKRRIRKDPRYRNLF